MKTLILAAHLNLEKSKASTVFLERNSARKEKAIDTLNIVDVYKKGLNVLDQQEILKKYNRIIFLSPIHWYNLTWEAIRYITDVFTYGWAYGGAHNLEGKTIQFIVTSGRPGIDYSKGGNLNTTIDEFFFWGKSLADYMKMKYENAFQIDLASSKDINQLAKESDAILDKLLLF